MTASLWVYSINLFASSKDITPPFAMNGTCTCSLNKNNEIVEKEKVNGVSVDMRNEKKMKKKKIIPCEFDRFPIDIPSVAVALAADSAVHTQCCTARFF